MAEPNHLYGSCACERNQYTVVIPSSSTSLATVFFDNSAATRRAQATPVTAWLRVPLDWYHSTTFAFFPDETHNAIKRTFHTPSQQPDLPPTRRQFCSFCGTHLTAWNEGRDHSADFLDVTLGSLLNESIETLEALHVIPSTTEDDDDEGLVKGGFIDDDDHVPTNEESMGGVDGPGASTAAVAPPRTQPISTVSAHRMHNRGMPYFEEMVENSRLGRIKRQIGGHTSQDGRTMVQWEVVEIGGDESAPMETAGGTSTDSNKRLKMDM